FALDTVGNLLIADGVRVRRVNRQGLIATVAGDGYLKFIGDGGPASAALLLRPTAVTVEAGGTVLIADAAMHRVRRVTAGGGIVTLAGTGSAGYQPDGLTAAVQSPLDGPSGVAVDPLGDVLVADTNNHRVRRVSADGRIRTVIGTGS